MLSRGSTAEQFYKRYWMIFIDLPRSNSFMEEKLRGFFYVRCGRCYYMMREISFRSSTSFRLSMICFKPAQS